MKGSVASTAALFEENTGEKKLIDVKCGRVGGDLYEGGEEENPTFRDLARKIQHDARMNVAFEIEIGESRHLKMREIYRGLKVNHPRNLASHLHTQAKGVGKAGATARALATPLGDLPIGPSLRCLQQPA